MPTLGKGLGSLIPSRSKSSNPNRDFFSAHAFDEEGVADDKKIVYVAIDKVTANPWQPRSNFDRDKLSELAESIKKHGIIQPLVVTKEGDNYQLIAGERRLKAAQALGLSEVPVIIKEATDRDKLELSIIENIQRADLNPLEEAASFQRLLEEFGLSQEEIAQQVGKSTSTISNTLRLLQLPVVIKEAIADNRITFSHAKIILSYPTKTEQVKIFKRILKNDLTVKQLDEMAHNTVLKDKKEKKQDPILTSYEDKLTRVLGAKVHIKKRGERGQIMIDFYSHEELKNLLNKLQK
ncbi:MAG: ParB/RepB/Spo0J family partition protein [Patescibacteria group bacterium]